MKQWKIIDDFSNKYTFSTFFRMAYSFVMTKVFWRKARIVTYPIYIHGKKKIKYGKGLMLGHDCRIDAINNKEATLFIGENCDFGNYCHISAVNHIIIGDNFLCGDSVYIGDSSHGNYSNIEGFIESDPFTPPSKRVLMGADIVIGQNVWVGEKASILPGVSIGDGCIIGANSVVTSSIQPLTMVAGNPARPIKRWNAQNNRWERI